MEGEDEVGFVVLSGAAARAVVAARRAGEWGVMGRCGRAEVEVLSPRRAAAALAVRLVMGREGAMSSDLKEQVSS